MYDEHTLGLSGPPPSPPQPIAVSVKQFCALTSLGRTTAFKLISEGALQTVAVRGRTLILWQSVEALLSIDAKGLAK